MNYSAADDCEFLERQQAEDSRHRKAQGSKTVDASKIMWDALTKIAHRDAFFDSEKELVSIARRAIEQVTQVMK